MLRRSFGYCISLCLLAGVYGCGGSGGLLPAGGGGGSGSEDSGDPPALTGAAGTARFSVDVATGKVTITPGSGGSSPSGRAVFSGTAIGFGTTQLLDLPGSTGIRVLNVTLKNQWSLPIGQLPDGTVTGLRVLFSNFDNLDAPNLDLRDQVTVSTVAGTGTAGWLDGSALAGKLSGPRGLARGPDGTVYIADFYNHRIRMLRSGALSTVAGSGAAGIADGAALTATFKYPWGIAYNPTDGSLVVADQGNACLRLVSASGLVSRIAGTGAAGYAEGAGNVARFSSPRHVAVSANGTIYVADSGNQRVRQVVLTGGDPALASSYTVSTLAGSGVVGLLDGVGTAARFYTPSGVALDDEGNLYVAESGGRVIRRVSPGGVVTTVAGTGTTGTTNGIGDVARFTEPAGLAWTSNGLVVTENLGNRLRLVSPRAGMSPASRTGWIVRWLAGSGSVGSAEGGGTAAQFNGPTGVVADGSGNVYVADSGNHKLRLVVPDNGSLTLGEGTGSTSAEPVQLSNATGVMPGPGGAALPFIDYQWIGDLNPPGRATGSVLAAGETSPAQPWWFIVPEGVRSFAFTVTVEAATAGLAPPEAVSNPGPTGAGSPNVLVSTLAGGDPGFLDGVGTQARLQTIELAADRFGNLYTAERFNHAIRRISSLGVVSTIAGVPGGGTGSTDGAGNVARFNNPRGIAVDRDGEVLYVADSGTHIIRRLALWRGADPTDPANWTVATIAGSAGNVGRTNGDGAAARFNEPTAVAVASGNVLYVVEREGARLRRMQLTGGDPSLPASWLVSVVAGDGGADVGATGTTDGLGTAARFDAPQSIAVDRAGNVYVADFDNARVRKVTPDGLVSTLAGPTGAATTGYADGTGAAARFNVPCGLTVDQAGYVYVADVSNHRIRRISPTGVVATVAGNGSSGNTDGRGDAATLQSPGSVAVDAAGNLYASSWARVRKVARVVSAGGQ